jgi:hypothetical protein
VKVKQQLDFFPLISKLETETLIQLNIHFLRPIL